MIARTYAAELANDPELLDQMFRLRARVFRDRLRWDVRVENGRESDEYDRMDPLYVMSIDDEGRRLRGAVRILPTTGPHMMRDVFNGFFDEPLDIVSPLIWECTRFAVDPGPGASVTSTGVNLATCELLLGILDAAAAAGVTQVLGVSETPMLRIYRRCGWMPEIVGRAEPRGGVSIFAGLWDVTAEARRSVAARMAGLASAALCPAQAA